MLRHLETYAGCGMGAEQDFLTDFWKTRKGIVGLPRRYNCQLHHRPGSTRRLRVLGDGKPSQTGGGKLALQCRPQASGYAVGEHRISRPGDWQWQQKQRLRGADYVGHASSGHQDGGAPTNCIWQSRPHISREGGRQGQGQEPEFDRAGPSADRACGTMEAQSHGGYPAGGDEQQVGEVEGCGSHRGAPSGNQPRPARGHTYVDSVLAAYGVAEHRDDGERRNPTPQSVWTRPGMPDLPSEVRVGREKHRAQLIPLPNGAPRLRAHRLGSVAGHGEASIPVAIRWPSHRPATVLPGDLAAGLGAGGGHRHGGALEPSKYTCFACSGASGAVCMC